MLLEDKRALMGSVVRLAFFQEFRSTNYFIMSPPEEEEEENSSREKKGTRMEYRSLIFPDENPNDSVSSANNFETFE